MEVVEVAEEVVEVVVVVVEEVVEVVVADRDHFIYDL